MSNTTTCPSCKRPLRIPDELVGQQVKCPACGTTFAANRDREEPAAPPEREREREAPQRRPDRREEDRPARRQRDEEEDDRPRRQRDEEEDRPRRRRDEEEDDRPRRRDDHDEDYDDRPRRRRRRDDFEDHRGTLILILGICSFVVAPIPFGPIAWFLGNSDLKEIRAGRMDPEGESSTQIGRILGMIATLLFLFVILIVCVVIGIIALAAGAR
jgi:hypothetical protein